MKLKDNLLNPMNSFQMRCAFMNVSKFSHMHALQIFFAPKFTAYKFHLHQMFEVLSYLERRSQTKVSLFTQGKCLGREVDISVIMHQIPVPYKNKNSSDIFK